VAERVVLTYSAATGPAGGQPIDGRGGHRQGRQPPGRSAHDNPVERIWRRSRRGCQLARWPSKAGSVRSMPSSEHAPRRSCWRPLRHTAHHGCPRVTCRTSGRPL